MRRQHKLTLTSVGRWFQLYFCLQLLLSGLAQGRIVIRRIAVLSSDGFTISDAAHSSVIPSSVAGGVGRASALKSSLVLDCVYELVPSGSHDISSHRAGDQALTVPPSTMATVTGAVRLPSSLPARGGNAGTSNSTPPPLPSVPPPVAPLPPSDQRMTDSEKPSAVPRVVKWFRNAEPTPFYQWIPAARSRLFHHAYRDLVDPMYKHSDRPEEMFRAVRITRPVRELSGNFSCQVQDADSDDGDLDEVEEQVAIHELLIYDPPTEFELHLDLASRQLRCEAWCSEQPTSVEIQLFRQDHDAWQAPLGPRVDLNSTSGFPKPSPAPADVTDALTGSSSATKSPETAEEVWSHTVPANNRQLFRVGAFARLGPEDVKHLEVDTSRTFVCEIVYDRLLRRSSDEAKPTAASPSGDEHTGLDHIFQRSVRIVNESPSSATDYEDPGEGPGPQEPLWYAWSAALTSGGEAAQTCRGCPTTVSVILVVLYIHTL